MAHKLVTLWQKFMQGLVSAKWADDETALRQARRVAAFVLAMLIWVPVYGTVFRALDAPISYYILLWPGASFVFVLALERLGVPPAVCGNVFVGSVWLAYTGLALVNGGVQMQNELTPEGMQFLQFSANWR